MIVVERTGGEEAPKNQIVRGMLNMEAKSCAKKGGENGSFWSRLRLEDK